MIKNNQIQIKFVDIEKTKDIAKENGNIINGDFIKYIKGGTTKKKINDVKKRNGIYYVSLDEREKYIYIKCKTFSNGYFIGLKPKKYDATCKTCEIRISKIRKTTLFQISAGIVIGFGGVTFFSVNFNFTFKDDKSVNWKMEANRNEDATFMCDHCRTLMFFDDKGYHFGIADIPYHYTLSLYNDIILKDIILHTWKYGNENEDSKIGMTLNYNSGRSEIGTYDVKISEDCVLRAGISISKANVLEVNEEALGDSVIYNQLLYDNKATLSQCEENEACDIGIYYQFIPKESPDPKITYGVIEIISSNEKREYFVYLQGKSSVYTPIIDNTINEKYVEEMENPTNSLLEKENTKAENNAFEIMTEESFRNKTAFYGFFEKNSILIEKMKRECEEIGNNSYKIGVYNACGFLNNQEDLNLLYQDILINLNRVKN